MPTIATVICTMNRPDDLATALQSLAACAPRPHQVVVSDDSPENDRRSEAMCRQFFQIAYRRGPRSGLGANRNAAISGVEAEWVHFIDDDVTVPVDFYETAAKAIHKAGDRSLICGAELQYKSRDDRSPIRVTPPRAGFWAHFEDPAGRPPNCVVINAALFPTQRLRHYGFDSRMKYGCEESDITCRFIANGYPLVFDPRLCVHHFSSPQNRAAYEHWVIASQVYAGLKRQWLYARSKSGAAAFFALAVPRLVLYHARRRGLKAGWSAVRQAGQGLLYFKDLMRERRSMDVTPPG